MKLFTGYEDAKVRSARSDEFGFACVGDSLTVQAQAQDADINVIMDRYARTGQMPGLQRLPSFGDFDGISDFREAVEAVREAESLFMQLPGKIRARFENDPQAFVEFCEKPENRLELADLGLLSKEATDGVKAEREVQELQKARVRVSEAAGRESSVSAESPRSDGDKAGSKAGGR